MAMNETDIKVVIAAELRKQGFDKAQKATGGLEKSFKKLGLTIAGVFSAQKLAQFGKQSVKAFLDDEKAAARLSKTLSNLGLAFEDPRLKSYVQSLQTQTGIVDDELRPALQALLTTTGSVTKSQELMALAIDTARGSGVDLQTVVNDLAQAYVGNTKGLKKYNLGLTQTELKTKSFADLQEALNKQFGGQSAAYLNTYAGKVDLLKAAYSDLQETVGKSLVDAFARLSGDEGIGGAQKAIEDFGTAASDAINGLSILLVKIKKPIEDVLRVFNIDFGDLFKFGTLGILSEIGKADRLAPKPFQMGMSVSGASDLYTKQDKDRKKAEAAALARAKALAALQKKAELERIKREKEAQALKRAGTVFDMQNIQIVAAMQGKISDEQRLRLVALLAINNDMADAADKTTRAILAIQAPALQSLGITLSASDNATTIIEKLIKAQTQLVLVNGGITSLPKAKNPFEDWDSVMKNIISNLDTIATKIKNMPSASTTTTATSTTSISTPSGTTTTTSIAAPTGLGAVARGEYPRVAEIAAAVLASNYAPDQVTAALGMGAVSRGEYSAYIPTPYSAGMGGFGRGEYGAPTVVVNVAGNVTTESDLVESIRDSLYNFQKSGGLINIESVAI
jgi:hypothetical protein